MNNFVNSWEPFCEMFAAIQSATNVCINQNAIKVDVVVFKSESKKVADCIVKFLKSAFPLELENIDNPDHFAKVLFEKDFCFRFATLEMNFNTIGISITEYNDYNTAVAAIYLLDKINKINIYEPAKNNKGLLTNLYKPFASKKDPAKKLRIILEDSLDKHSPFNKYLNEHGPRDSRASSTSTGCSL